MFTFLKKACCILYSAAQLLILHGKSTSQLKYENNGMLVQKDFCLQFIFSFLSTVHGRYLNDFYGPMRLHLEYHYFVLYIDHNFNYSHIL